MWARRLPPTKWGAAEKSKRQKPGVLHNDFSACNAYQGGEAATGPCGIFPGQAVDAKGWCSAYAKKPA